jgi:hypothetical protein
MITAFLFLSDLGRGHPEIVNIFLSGLAKVQQILSRKAIIIAVANPMCTEVFRKQASRPQEYRWLNSPYHPVLNISPPGLSFYCLYKQDSFYKI